MSHEFDSPEDIARRARRAPFADGWHSMIGEAEGYDQQRQRPPSFDASEDDRGGAVVIALMAVAAGSYCLGFATLMLVQWVTS